MTATDLILDTLPTLKTSDTPLMAIELFAEFGIDELPVVASGKYLGLLTEDMVMDMKQANDSFKKNKATYKPIYIHENAHLFEVINVFTQNNLKLLPVIKADETYLGSISIHSLLSSFSEKFSLQKYGAILEIEVEKQDYSFAEISRLIESNDVHVLAAYAIQNPENGKYHISLKLDQSDLGGVIATLERYNYKVVASYQETEYAEDLKKRYNELMNYLSI